MNVWDEVVAERKRAHVKHGDSSMESMHPLDGRRLAVLVEEVGEVARALNDIRHQDGRAWTNLRNELIQVAAMAGAWADAIA